MKFKVEKSVLIEGLRKVNSVIGARSTLPILSNVLVEAKDNSLVLTSTDLELRVTTTVKADVEVAGTTTLPSKSILLWVQNLGDDVISFSRDEGHHMTMEAGTSSYTAMGLPPDDFPLPIDFSSTRNFSVKGGDLASTLGKVSYAASTDDSRKTLNGVLFAVKDKAFTVVATDGKRLALVERIVENFSGEDGQAIVPQKTVQHLQQVFASVGDDVSIEFGDSQASFKSNDVKVSTKLVEGAYPNYRQVIPVSFSRKVEIPSDVFSSAMKRIAIVVSDSGAFVQLKFVPSKIEITTVGSPSQGLEEVPIEYDGPEIAVSFNPAFLIAPFKYLAADKVTMQLNDGYNPVALSCGDGFLYVIMPMRNK